MKNIKDFISSDALDKAKKLKMPSWINPMLATLTHEYFDDEDWIYERKLDGERCLVYCDEKQNIRLMSRNKKELNKRYPEIVSALEKQHQKGYIIDGEIVAFKDGVSDFSSLQGRMHLSQEEEIEDSDIEVYYYLFDIVYIDGYDIRDIALKERKKILKSLFDYTSPIYYTEHHKESGKAYLKEACKKGWEGLIAKDYDSEYSESRSRKWLKFKCEQRQEFIIIGYTNPEGERIGFGALLIGYYDDDELKYAGKVGTGYTDELLKELHQQFQAIKIDTSPLANPDEVDTSDVHWLEPKMVGEVSFTEWTSSHKLRHPSFEGIRTDKDPKDVVNEEKRRKK